jgi:hypothetical protein
MTVVLEEVKILYAFRAVLIVLRAMASVADFHEQQKLETLFVIMN